ncbi:hypothetical protein, conserved [Leishmania lindenbergi]|uniref:Uncharacterized protein n=1 Tax=Leishmania lindenbergi TaxID=651832 RepID=A0AAW3A1S7_9TRYP
MEAVGPPPRDGAAATVSLDQCCVSVPAHAMHAVSLGESDDHSCGDWEQFYMATVNVNPTSSSPHTLPRIEKHESNDANTLIVTPAAATETSGMLTLEEILDGPASCPSSTSAAPTDLAMNRLLTTAQRDSRDKQRAPPAAGPAYAEKDVTAAALTEHSKGANTPTELSAVANLAPLSSSSRAVQSGSSVVAAPAHSPAPSAGLASSGVPLSVLTTLPADLLVATAAESATLKLYQETSSPHANHDATAGLQAAGAGNVAGHSPIAKTLAAKGEGSSRPLVRATSCSAARAVRREVVGREHNSSEATVSKRERKTGGVTTAYIAALLRGILGTPMPADRAVIHSRKTWAVSTAPPPIATLDLPVGLLVLYCAAEETCAALEGERASSTTSTAATSAYSLLYILEQISEARCRDHRQAALKQASELEQAKCEELYKAAEKKRALHAAHQAARAQAVEQEELGACTFHPAVSEAAQRMKVTGAKNFMQRCMDWKAQMDCRLRQKYDQRAEAEAEQWTAAAAQIGILAPDGVVTEGSRRLLAEPSVQERLKSRPCLWEAKRPSENLWEAGVSVFVPAHAPTDTAASFPHLLGAPITSSIVEDQEAVLRDLRRPGTGEGVSCDPSLLQQLQGTPPPRASKSSGGTVKGFLRRVEQDARRREQTVAKLRARYHNPDTERFEGGTGQPLFQPNAMPTAWKDGHRVSYDDLSKEEQESFRAELRRTGLDFVLSHYLRERQREKQQGVTDSPREPSAMEQGDGADTTEGGTVPRHSTSSQSHGHIMAMTHHARFMASLEAALERKKKNWERLRAQATAEETFHPQITKQSVRMALHKTGGTPIYGRPVEPRREASASGARLEKSPQQTSSSFPKDRPLPEVAKLFLARNGKWMESRQRRLQHLAEMEEERRYAGCTFTPNCHFTDTREMTGPPLGVEAGLTGASSHTDSSLAPCMAGGEVKDHRGASQSHVRPQSLMASAADVRVMNELELLRSGAAYRDEGFVQAVCERSGLADARRAMANLSLHSAPRLSRSRKDARRASKPTHQSSVSLSQSPLSPILQRSERPSASPYLLPRRDTRASFSLFQGSVPRPAPAHLQTESTQTPMRRSVAGDATAVLSGARDSVSSFAPVEDPWAALDAQIDAILKLRRR